MNRMLKNQVQRAGIPLAATVVISMLLTGPATAQEFVRPELSVNSFGFLECAFRETGLLPGASITHTCGAEAVGWLTQCYVKNKPVGNEPPMLHIAKNEVTMQTRTANRRGTITATILTAYPTPEQEIGPEPCSQIVVGGPGKAETEVEEVVTAIRWCNASLIDTTNNISGAAEPELFLQLERNGAGSVPGCEVLLNSQPIP